MLRSLLLFGLVAAALACDKYPNGTASAMHWYNCASSKIVASSITVTDAQGNPDYPLNVKKDIVLHLDQVNNGQVYDKVLADVLVASWSDGGFLGCKWVNIPTFGLLNNLDGCQLGGNCPIKTGESKVDMHLDLGQFGPVVNLLSEGTAYQIAISLKNGGSSAKEQIGCVAVQGQITKK